MKLRVLAVPAVVGALFLSVSGAEAGPKVMDGKKLKVINVSAKAALQTNDKDIASDTDRLACKPARCSKTPFVYKPAKGVKGGLMLTSTWANTLTDVDLYLAIVNPNKSLTQISTCGASTGSSEKVYAPPSALRPGRTYVMVMDFYRTNTEVVKGKIQINVPDSTPKTVPDRAEALPFVTVNCTL